MPLTEILLLRLVGLVSGSVIAVAGGGSLILFPALLATGPPPLDANVTNSIAQWPSYLGATYGQRSDLQGHARRLRLVLPMAGSGSLCGAVLLLALSLAVATVTVLVFSALGAPVHWTLVAVVGPATLLGGFLGAKVAKGLNDQVLRWSAVVLGTAVGRYLLVS